MCAICIPCASPGRPHRGVPKNLPLPLRPALRKMIAFPSSLATRHSSLVPIFSFQPLTNCPICKSFVLITIQQYPGWVGGLLLRPSRRTLAPVVSDPVSSTLVPRIRHRRVRGLSASPSTFNSELSAVDLRKSFTCNTCEHLVTVDSKRLTRMLSPLAATLTKNRGEGSRSVILATCHESSRMAAGVCADSFSCTNHQSRVTKARLPCFFLFFHL
jgi:hypothetical protein